MLESCVIAVFRKQPLLNGKNPTLKTIEIIVLYFAMLSGQTSNLMWDVGAL